MTPMQSLAFDCYRKEFGRDAAPDWADVEPHKQVFFLEVAESKMMNLLEHTPDVIISRSILTQEMINRSMPDTHSNDMKMGQYVMAHVQAARPRFSNMAFRYDRIEIKLPTKDNKLRAAMYQGSIELGWWDIDVVGGDVVTLTGMKGEIEVKVS